MKREFAILGIVVGVVVGFFVGWFVPPLFAPAPEARVSLLDTIKTRGELIMGTSPDYPPFENKTYPGGEIIGFDIDVSEMIADHLGVTLVKTEMDFDSLIGACRAGTIDMIAAAMTYTPQRAQELAPSATYFTVSQVVMVMNDSTKFPSTITNLTELADSTVGVQSGTVMQEEIDAIKAANNITVIAFSRVDLLIADLVADQIDAAYVDGPIYEAWKATEDLRVIYSTAPEPLALWTQLGEPEFLYEINEVILSSYLDGSMYDLINLWFGNVTA